MSRPKIKTIGNLLTLLESGPLSGNVDFSATPPHSAFDNIKAYSWLQRQAGGLQRYVSL